MRPIKDLLMTVTAANMFAFYLVPNLGIEGALGVVVAIAMLYMTLKITVLEPIEQQ